MAKGDLNAFLGEIKKGDLHSLIAFSVYADRKIDEGIGYWYKHEYKDFDKGFLILGEKTIEVFYQWRKRGGVELAPLLSKEFFQKKFFTNKIKSLGIDTQDWNKAMKKMFRKMGSKHDDELMKSYFKWLQALENDWIKRRYERLVKVIIATVAEDQDNIFQSLKSKGISLTEILASLLTDVKLAFQWHQYPIAQILFRQKDPQAATALFNFVEKWSKERKYFDRDSDDDLMRSILNEERKEWVQFCYEVRSFYSK
ncbi:MAG: hypothetical protein AB1711_08395 [Thermodesulfobacteriota bacterium]